MITVTEKAKDRILEIIKLEGLGDDYFLRASVIGGGCSGLSYQLDFDNKLDDKDQIFEDKGVMVVCDLKSFLYIADTQLDFSDGLNGKGFNFFNPNATRTCGCGESFSV